MKPYEIVEPYHEYGISEVLLEIDSKISFLERIEKKLIDGTKISVYSTFSKDDLKRQKESEIEEKKVYKFELGETISGFLFFEKDLEIFYENCYEINIKIKKSYKNIKKDKRILFKKSGKLKYNGLYLENIHIIFKCGHYELIEFDKSIELRLCYSHKLTAITIFNDESYLIPLIKRLKHFEYNHLPEYFNLRFNLKRLKEDDEIQFNNNMKNVYRSHTLSIFENEIS